MRLATATGKAHLGRELEAMLQTQHDEYWRRKVGKIDKNPVEWAYTSPSDWNRGMASAYDCVAKTNQGRFLKRLKSNVDFSGCVRGRFVTFDAKMTARPSWPLADIEAHQITRLVEKEKVGGVAGIMLFFSDKRRLFFVPATAVEKAYFDQRNGGRKSLPISFCEEHGTEVPINGRVCDWAAVVLGNG